MAQQGRQILKAWALGVSGEPYILSVLNDFVSEPRWRPEWIADHFLIGDAYERASSIVYGLPDGRVPESWRTRLSITKVWIEEKSLHLLAHFPAVLEGTRQRHPAPTRAMRRLLSVPVERQRSNRTD